MKRLLTALIALSVAAPAADAATKPRTITQPDWMSLPDGEAMSRVYPKLGQAMEIEGRAIISCEVTDLGALSQCKVQTETPAGVGFGAAALALAPSFRMRPMAVDGRPTSGGVVRIPINFRLPADKPPPEATFSPRTAAHLRVAREVAELLGGAWGKFLDERANEIEFLVEDADQEKLAAAAASLRASNAVFTDRFLSRASRVYAELFTEQELVAWRAFLRSPGGRVQRFNGEVVAALSQLQARGSARQIKLVREAFCRRVACVTDLDTLRIGRRDDDATVESPRWSETPDDMTVWNAMPPLARSLGVAGYVRLACRVTPEGLLTRCAVRDEAPKGLGFGNAAIALAPAFRLTGEQVSQGASGELVNVHVPISPGEPETGADWSVSPSSSARALAEQLIDEDGSSAAPPPGWFESEFPKDPSQSAEARAAAPAAFIEARQAVMRYLRDEAVKIVASSFTESQMREAVAFRAGPVGLKQRDSAVRLYEMIGMEATLAGREAYAEARRTFCAAHACDAKAPQSTGVSPPSTR